MRSNFAKCARKGSGNVEKFLKNLELEVSKKLNEQRYGMGNGKLQGHKNSKNKSNCLQSS